MVNASARAVFCFKHQRPSHDQRVSTCTQLRDLLVRSIDTMMEMCSVAASPTATSVDRAVPVDALTPSDCEALRSAMCQLKDRVNGEQLKRGDVRVLHWFPEYAGVLLGEYRSASGVANHVNTSSDVFGSVALSILGLDGWELAVHFYEEEGVSSSEDSAVSRTYQVC